jgi:hypothetical protein
MRRNELIEKYSYYDFLSGIFMDAQTVVSFLNFCAPELYI